MLLASASVMTVTGCGASTGDGSTPDALTAALSAAAGAEVHLSRAVSGTWTRVLFVCPYADEKYVQKMLGFAWEDFPGPDMTEGRVTFVFATDSEVVTWATVSRRLGDPCSGPTPPPNPTGKKSAVYRVVRTNTTVDGTPFYSLVPKG